MDIIIITWLHRLIALVALIACSFALFYITQIVNKMSGCFRKSFGFIGWGVFFITIRVVILNLGYWGFLDINEIVILVRDIFTGLSTVFIAIGVLGFSRVISFMPKPILDKINDNC